MHRCARPGFVMIIALQSSCASKILNVGDLGKKSRSHVQAFNTPDLFSRVLFSLLPPLLATKVREGNSFPKSA